MVKKLPARPGAQIVNGEGGQSGVNGAGEVVAADEAEDLMSTTWGAAA